MVLGGERKFSNPFCIPFRYYNVSNCLVDISCISSAVAVVALGSIVERLLFAFFGDFLQPLSRVTAQETNTVRMEANDFRDWQMIVSCLWYCYEA